jgi:glycerophosphoryl diester phosphodiesterase
MTAERTTLRNRNGAQAPFVVAHRAGNDLARLRAAEALGISLVEADVHLFRGRVEVRHLKTIGPLPILWDRWRLANPFAPRLLLYDLLAAVSPDTELMIDLKGRDERLCRHVLDALAATPPRRTTVCSRSWSLLEPFRGRPRIRVVHSVGSARQLRMLLRRYPMQSLQGVSIHERLLDGTTVQELRRRAALVVTWPVNTLQRARDLAAWGVDGMISDRPELTVELAGAPADA